MKLSRFAGYAWGVLAFNLIVILWGAFVRATGSGAGCGSHWPLCNGQAIPRAPQVETIIEFSHRLSSGLSLVLIAGLVLWAFRSYPKGHRVRFGAVTSGLFIVTEALIGAGLVLFGLVADNNSVARAVSMSLHLANTLLLLASLVVTAWWASGGESVELRQRDGLLWSLRGSLLLLVVLSISGAVTALGDTLNPAASLGAGLRQDFSLTAGLLVRLRVLHPVLAIVIGMVVLLVARSLLTQAPNPTVHRLAQFLSALVVLQWVAGFVNVGLLAPVWMQLVHLLLADLVWIVLVLLAVSLTAVPVPQPRVVPSQA